MRNLAILMVLAIAASGCGHLRPAGVRKPDRAEELSRQREARRKIDEHCGGLAGSHQIPGTRGTVVGDYDCGKDHQ